MHTSPSNMIQPQYQLLIQNNIQSGFVILYSKFLLKILESLVPKPPLTLSVAGGFAGLPDEHALYIHRSTDQQRSTIVAVNSTYWSWVFG